MTNWREAEVVGLMQDWLATRVKATPHALALITDDNQWTYTELDKLVQRYASHLASLVRPGEHVGVLLPNNLAYVCLIHALARIGAVLVPLNTRLTNQEVSWQLRHSDCTLLITTAEMAEGQAALSKMGMRMLLTHEIDNDPRRAGVLRNAPFNLANKQAIIFTSGTSGQPKGAVLTFANHFWSATASAFRLGVNKEDRWLNCLPLYHIGGLAIILRSCLYGTAVVLHERFDEQAVGEALESHAITLMSLVPTMVHRLLDYQGTKAWPASLRHVLLGGAAAGPELIERCLERHIPLSLTYGLTEAASQVATMPHHESWRKLGSAGKPLLFTTVEIIDEQGQQLGPGEAGEVCVSGPTVMAGYYKDQQATARTLRNGRLHTGDMGYLDEDGDLWLIQRRYDIIITGGENVYPTEVENMLRQHPAISDVCVTGVADNEWGQRVAAMIVLHSGSRLTVNDLINFGREKLAGYKLPRQVQFVNELPLTSTGKIHRQRVSEALHQQNHPITTANRANGPNNK